jgi:hypothetical protein
MVLFHLSFKAPADVSVASSFRVDLNHEIPMQPMTYVKSIVRFNYNSTNALTNSVIYARLPWLSHYEVTNNIGENLLPVAFQPVPANPASETQTYTAEQYGIKFKPEDIPRSFDVEFFQDDGVTPMEFKLGFANKIQSIDLYFEYAHNDTFH